jgi:hypothetical protein
MISPDCELTPPQKLSSNSLERSVPEVELWTIVVPVQKVDVVISCDGCQYRYMKVDGID